MHIIRQIDADFWWAVARKSPNATFFHTPLWQELALRTTPGSRDATIGAILPSGVRAVLPLIETRRLGVMRKLLSTHEYCYGGVIADGPITHAERQAILAAACDWRTFSVRYLQSPLENEPGPAGVAPILDETTYMVSLDGTFEEVFARFNKNCRNSYRKGIKEGVQVREATGIDDYRAYFAAYRDTVSRWGEDESYGYDWGLFVQIEALAARNPEQVKLWVADVDGQLAAGTIVFYWNRHAVAWHGAAHRDFLKLRPMNVLDTEIMRDANARGCAFYDFNTSSSLQGVIEYKRSYGSLEYSVAHYQHMPAHIRASRELVQKTRQLIATRATSATPRELGRAGSAGTTRGLAS